MDIDFAQSVMVVGDAPATQPVVALLARSLEPEIVVKQCADIDDALRVAGSVPDIALILLLWEGGCTEQLIIQVRALSEGRGYPQRSIMVRSRSPLAAQVMTTLWQLGVADRSFHQALNSAELIHSVLVALRHHGQQVSAASILKLSGVFSGAANLRELARLSLQSILRHCLPVRDGLFCFLDSTPAAQPMIIAGTGCYAEIGCMSLDTMVHAKPSDLLTLALSQRQSQFRDDEMALWLVTPNGFASCLYFVLAAPLHASHRGLLATISDMIATAIDQVQLAHKLLRTQQATITTLSELAEYRDVDTGEHVARVARMTTEIAQILSLQAGQSISPELLLHIGLASILHDTGKIGISDDILLKPGPLSPDERLAMRQHVVHGHNILMRAAQRTVDCNILTLAAEIARHHHERFDGSGYPDGLRGEAIPLAARIVALVDVYDALTSQRPYKLPWSHAAAMEEIRAQSGRHFDPMVVDAFLQLDEFRISARRIEWSTAMSVSQHDLDADHRHLIEIINRLWMADRMSNRQIIEFVLDDLVNYTESHFAREEGLMKQTGFPGYEHHREIHGTICRRLGKIRWEYFQGIRDELRSELLEFVTGWLNQHILHEDMQYGRYIAAQA